MKTIIYGLRFTAMAFALAAMFSCSDCGNTDKSTSFPAKWIFNADNMSLYEETWCSDNEVYSMSSDGAVFTAVRADETTETPLTFKLSGSKPSVGTLIENDYLLWRIPVSFLEAGSYIEIDATVFSEPASPKYFIIEYFEDGQWKNCKDDLYDVPENPELKYSFLCSGIASGKNYQHSNIYQTIRLENEITDGELMIRFRAVGSYTCNGKPQSPDAKKGATGLVSFGFIGAYIQDYGTQTPEDTIDVLCLGNSFTYYANSPSMLKEIAWSEGHYFDICAHLKGGQTLGQHTRLSMTHNAIRSDDFEWAIIQDQSQATARYADNAKEFAYILDDYLLLSDMILEHSKECKILLEDTWAYDAIDFGGFGSFDRFHDLLKEGAIKMAATNGMQVSYIGDAYKAVNEGSQKINLYDEDDKHQSHYGSYIKACVNYLTIVGEPFGDNTANCGIAPDKAKYLRDVAESICLQK